MAITADMVKKLREQTGAGMMDCKKALTETDGDYEKAVTVLREKGIAVAAKRETKAASEGLIGSYISGDAKIGAMVELNCETTFVAKTDEFGKLTKDLAAQAANEHRDQLVGRHAAITPVVLARTAVAPLDDEVFTDGAGGLDVRLGVDVVVQDDVRLADLGEESDGARDDIRGHWTRNLALVSLELHRKLIVPHPLSGWCRHR
jgi:hypothetical protein